MIRLAQMTDLPRILELMIEAAGKSRYAQLGGVHRPYAKKFLQETLFLNGVTGESGTWVSVYVKDGTIEGFHIGMQQRIGLVGTRFEATDAQFYVSDRAGAFAFSGLLDSFFKWASRNPRIAIIRPGVTDMLDDIDRTAAIYERLGFRKSGHILELPISGRAA